MDSAKQMKKNFYPSKRKRAEWNTYQDEPKTLSLNKPFMFSDSICDSIFEKWQTSFSDAWVNSIASINSNNSLMQYSEFVNERMSYAECAAIATESIINNAISKINDDIFARGGVFKIESTDVDKTSELQTLLLREFQRLGIWDSLKKAVFTNLVFGGAFIFFDFDSEDLSKEFYYKQETLRENKFRGLKIVPPYLVAPKAVETANPLSPFYMNPQKWFISGSATIDSTRCEILSFFEAPDLIKPLYNFFGIPYTQFMKPYVMSADIARQSLSDLFLRFRSEAIKTDLVKINMQDAKARANAINKMKNNLGVLLLTPDEEYIQTITPLTGLDKILAQMQENIAVSARMPAVKLLGLTPSGFNATGDYDLHSYYDFISSLQNVKVKPIIEKIAKIILMANGYESLIEYEFDLLEKESSLEKAQVENLNADFVAKNIQNGLITQEQGLEILKEKENLPNSITYDEADAGLNDLENLL